MDRGTVETVSNFFEIAGRMRRRYLDVAESFGLTEPQLALIEALEAGPVAMRSAAERMHCDPSNVTGIVDRLEQRGLVTRRRRVGDRRINELLLTDAGLELLEAHRSALYEVVPLLDNLNDRDRAQLGRLLAKALGPG